MPFRKGYTPWNKGSKGLCKGHIAWNKGRHLSEETKQKMGKSKLGEKNPNWKGDAKIDNAMLHRWVRRRLPKPEFCESCYERPSFDLANITGVYNRDLENWMYLCRRCHMISDGRIKNLKHFSQSAWQ